MMDGMITVNFMTGPDPGEVTISMSARRLWSSVLLGAALSAAGCGASPALTPTPAAPETPGPAVGDLPPGCDPIDLRSPTGDRIELDGTWVHSEGGEMTWWIRTLGSCIWGAGTVDDVPEDPLGLSTNPATVQILSGSIQTDFVIEGEIVLVGPPGLGFGVNIHAPVRLLIEFDDSGAVSIREDRVYGDQGPRCNPFGNCLQPIVLRLQTAVGN
jgi:hypothetical protein